MGEAPAPFGICRHLLLEAFHLAELILWPPLDDLLSNLVQEPVSQIQKSGAKAFIGVVADDP